MIVWFTFFQINGRR